MALSRINDLDAQVAAARNDSRPVRLGAVLALRRLERPEIAVFLKDADDAVVLEAARAINDLPINGAMTELAALIDKPMKSEMLLRRVLNANFRHGVKQTAGALAGFVAKAEAPETMRVEALNALADWPKPSGRDRVTGMWRPTSFVRDARTPADALMPIIAGVLRTAPDPVRLAAARAAGRLAITDATPALRDVVADTERSANVRIEALRALVDLNDARAADAVKLALSDKDEDVRREATRLQVRIKPSDAIGPLVAVLESGTIGDKQVALAELGTLPDPAADGVLAKWLDDLQAGKVAKELQLDVLEAAAKRPAPAIKQKLVNYEASRPRDDPMAKYRELLWGGNAAEGRKIFFERPEASCMRCHKINGEGGEVGPDLSKVGAQKDRQYILESVLFPNKQIAPGFDSVMVTLKNGTLYAGVLKQETDSELVINSPEDGLVTVKKADLRARDKGSSGMPEGMDGILSKQDLRNLVEFLGSLK
jgi:quinoprotein glucose dehydrogenase